MSKDQKLYIVEGTSSTDSDGFEMRSLSKLGGTEADEQEMRMLGRTQVLNVRTSRSRVLLFSLFSTDDLLTEKLPLHLDPGFCLYTDEHLGNRPHVGSPNSYQEVPVP